MEFTRVLAQMEWVRPIHATVLVFSRVFAEHVWYFFPESIAPQLLFAARLWDLKTGSCERQCRPTVG